MTRSRQPRAGSGSGYREIAEQLKRRLICECWESGRQLPPQQELRREFKVSPQTIQRAVALLQESGFVVSRSTSGTYVAARPPHRHRYALMLPGRYPDGEPASLYWRALRDAALTLSRRGPDEIVTLITRGEADTGGDWLPRLLEELRADRLAGLISALPWPAEVRAELVAHPHTGRVSLSAATEAGVPHVTPDLESFYDRACAWLRESGRQRPAFLVPAGAAGLMPLMSRACRRHQLTFNASWVQLPTVTEPVSVRQCVQLLLAGSPKTRPDALVLGDDHLIEAALAGVLAAGVRLPQELAVVAFANFPVAVPSALPLRRLGFVAADLLHRAIAAISTQQRGEAAPPTIKLAAVFENE